MKTIPKFFILTLAVLIVSAFEARAEFHVWVPINPQFTGGNPLNGPWILGKEQATNEYTDDKLEKMMAALMRRIDDMTQSITDHLDNLDLTINMPFMMQIGSYNTGVLGGSGWDGSATTGTGSKGSSSVLDGWKPSWGAE